MNVPDPIAELEAIIDQSMPMRDGPYTVELVDENNESGAVVLKDGTGTPMVYMTHAAFEAFRKHESR